MIRKHLLHSFATLLTICAMAVPLRASDTDYREGMKALSAKDYATALRYLESAVSAEPDNVRYASEYRQAAIQSKEFDRSLQLFGKLAGEHPASANVHLNWGFAYVDKIPAAGSITQVILANNALKEFTKAVELQPDWINYYTRGMSYLFWPKVFSRASFGVDDLNHALKLQETQPQKSYYVKTYIGLGDGYWKTDDLKKARDTWKKGLKKFPGNADLKARLEQEADQLQTTIEAAFDPNKRVDTDLRELWESLPN
jgi:tetratricopeptide (TPR) repeat protein